MGQPGNVLINRASFVNFWNYNCLSRTSARTTTLLNNLLLKKLINIFFRYSYLSNASSLINFRWYPGQYMALTTKYLFNFYRKIEILNKNLNIKTFFIGRRQINDFLSSKLWVYRYCNWLLLTWYTYSNVVKSQLSANNSFSFVKKPRDNVIGFLKFKLIILAKLNKKLYQNNYIYNVNIL